MDNFEWNEMATCGAPMDEDDLHYNQSRTTES